MHNKNGVSTPVIIHLFALAHALIAIMSRVANYVDDVPLTILTLALVVIIALRHGLQAEIVAILALMSTLVGYLLGLVGGDLIELIIHDRMLAPALTTALLTELLGWGIYAFARVRGGAKSIHSSWKQPIPQIIVIAIAILLFRISYTLIFNSSYISETSITTELNRLLENTVAILVMLSGNMLFVSFRTQFTDRIELRSAFTVLLTLLFSAAITLLVYYDFPHGNGKIFAMLPFLRLYAVILLCDVVVYALFKLVDYVLISHAELHAERGKKHQAQFQYNKLKMQINPHFLFNSLNILDFLVLEQETERASAFIHKLSDCYRYMLKNEDEQLVLLQEELIFARKYAELLQERFTSGFSIRYEIQDDCLARHIVPCALQLLIENATKHNIVSPDQPLEITIRTEGDRLLVSNPLQPRLSKQPSTRKGLNNIRQQYLDLSGKEIVVEQTDTEFRVELPLL
ncbi:MAG: histidine kinase [Rikenellaceae bacterium]|nr:histidine kinase [Rikenellaceae bacterium]